MRRAYSGPPAEPSPEEGKLSNRNSITLASSDHSDVKALIDWATRSPGVEAFAVYDYIPLEVPNTDGNEAVPGPLNGITVQWDIHDELVLETDDDEPNVAHPVAGGAVHVRPGQTLTITAGGYTVEGTPLALQEVQA
jgi:hypothetical protein